MPDLGTTHPLYPELTYVEIVGRVNGQYINIEEEKASNDGYLPYTISTPVNGITKAESPLSSEITAIANANGWGSGADVEVSQPVNLGNGGGTGIVHVFTLYEAGGSVIAKKTSVIQGTVSELANQNDFYPTGTPVVSPNQAHEYISELYVNDRNSDDYGWTVVNEEGAWVPKPLPTDYPDYVTPEQLGTAVSDSEATLRAERDVLIPPLKVFYDNSESPSPSVGVTRIDPITGHVYELIGDPSQPIASIEHWKIKGLQWDTPEQHGYNPAGSNAEKTAAMQSWAASPILNKTIRGDYETYGSLNFVSGSIVDGEGTIIGDVSGSSTIENVETPPVLATTVSGNKGSNIINVTDSSTIQKGDLLCITNTADYSFGPHREYYRSGEFVTVSEVTDSTTIVIHKNLYDDYTSVDLYKIEPFKLTLRNIKVTNTVSGTYAIRVRYGRNVKIHCDSYGGEVAALSFYRTYDFNVTGTHINDFPASGLQYGVSIGNSQRGVLQGHFHGTRHGFSTGGNSEICSVPCRDIRVSDSSVTNDPATSVNSFNTHGNTENLILFNSYTSNGTNLGGKDIFVVNTKIDASQNAILKLTEVVGGTIAFINCGIKTSRNVNASMIESGVTSNHLIAGVEATKIEFDGNDIEFTQPQTTTMANHIRNRGMTEPLSFVFTGNLFKGIQMDRFMRLDLISGSPLVDRFDFYDNEFENSGFSEFLRFNDGYLIDPKFRIELPVQVVDAAGAAYGAASITASANAIYPASTTPINGGVKVKVINATGIPAGKSDEYILTLRKIAGVNTWVDY